MGMYIRNSVLYISTGLETLCSLQKSSSRVLSFLDWNLICFHYGKTGKGIRIGNGSGIGIRIGIGSGIGIRIGIGSTGTIGSTGAGSGSGFGAGFGLGAG
jgi:hypothetical protein